MSPSGGSRSRSANHRETIWAFNDESERASLMLMGVLLLPATEVVAARRELRALLLAGQRRVHTAKESPRRRRMLLDVVAQLQIDVVVFTFRRPAGLDRVTARHHLLVAAAVHVVDRNVRSWVLDAQEPAQAARDRQSIATVVCDDDPFVYDHRTSRFEPLLWAVDGVVVAAGAGGEWLRRVDHLVATIEIEP